MTDPRVRGSDISGNIRPDMGAAEYTDLNFHMCSADIFYTNYRIRVENIIYGRTVSNIFYPSSTDLLTVLYIGKIYVFR